MNSEKKNILVLGDICVGKTRFINLQKPDPNITYHECSNIESIKNIDEYSLIYLIYAKNNKISIKNTQKLCCNILEKYKKEFICVPSTV